MREEVEMKDEEIIEEWVIEINVCGGNKDLVELFFETLDNRGVPFFKKDLLNLIKKAREDERRKFFEFMKKGVGKKLHSVKWNKKINGLKMEFEKGEKLI